MIRLTFNAQSGPEIHLFNKSIILIGSEPTAADLVILNECIQPVHLKLLSQGVDCFLINHVNDPFAAVNGYPFGKIALRSNDIITIQEYTLVFEQIDDSSECKTAPSSAKSCLLIKNEAESTSSPQLSLIEKTAPLQLNQFNQSDALSDDLIENFNHDKLNEYLEKINFELSQNARASEKKTSASLKDDYLKDLDYDQQKEGRSPFEEDKESNHLYQAWKWILLFIFSLLTFSAAIGTILYFSMSDKAGMQEVKAIQGISDVAMALTHAQINHIKPHNHNWSDIDFLKSNLQAILPNTHSHAANIDSQGQFNSFPYSLRIYTSNDLSHFLLIAQPAPGLLNWLISPSLIVVDSHLMEIRSVADVRSLNRLLACPDPLSGSQDKEIAALINQGTLITLSSLAKGSNSKDFEPPKNLALENPGAENVIYNAPRYFRLGQRIFNQCIELSTTKVSSQCVVNLKQDIQNLSHFNQWILYSHQGENAARLAKHEMELYAPNTTILFGYILLNENNIPTAHLLVAEEQKKDEDNDLQIIDEKTVAIAEPLLTDASEKENMQEISTSLNSINHPIYTRLQAFLQEREAELKSISNQLFRVAQHNENVPLLHFQKEFQALSKTFLDLNEKYNLLIGSEINNLYHEYSDLSIQQFCEILQSLHLEVFMHPDGNKQSIFSHEVQEEPIQTLLQDPSLPANEEISPDDSLKETEQSELS